jgi:hypothetical protein
MVLVESKTQKRNPNEKRSQIGYVLQGCAEEFECHHFSYVALKIVVVGNRLREHSALYQNKFLAWSARNTYREGDDRYSHPMPSSDFLLLDGTLDKSKY